MKKFLVICIVLSSLAGTSQQLKPNWFSLKLFLPAWNGAAVSVTKNGLLVSSGKISNDMFSLTGYNYEPVSAVISLSRGSDKIVFPFFIEQGTIRITAKSEFNLSATGTPLNDAYADFERFTDSLSELQPNVEARSIKRAYAVNLINRHCSSLLSLRLLNEYFYLDPASDDSVYYHLYTKLDEKLKHTLTGNKLGADAASRWSTAPGNHVPEVYLVDSLSELQPVYQKGKVNVIHYWASWCVPCKRQLPSFERIVRRYADSINVVMISLDQDKTQWLKAIGENKGWLHLIDLHGWNGESVKRFSVKSLPDTFIIGADGKIIRRHSSIEQLDKTLSEILD